MFFYYNKQRDYNQQAVVIISCKRIITKNVYEQRVCYLLARTAIEKRCGV